MAIKDATCPVCGKSIKLNDEKPFGFCSFCGHKIDTAEYFSAKVPKASAVQAETDKPEPAAAPISAPTPTPAAAPSIKITQDAQSSAISQIEAMYTLCSTEQEYMGLRQRVLDGAYSDQDKAVMVSELDRLMSKRLHNELALEADLPAAKEEGLQTRDGNGIDRRYRPCRDDVFPDCAADYRRSGAVLHRRRREGPQEKETVRPGA